jgi:hypothetical protein
MFVYDGMSSLGACRPPWAKDTGKTFPVEMQAKNPCFVCTECSRLSSGKLKLSTQVNLLDSKTVNLTTLQQSWVFLDLGRMDEGFSIKGSMTL